MRYKVRYATIILLENGTLGMMPNEFANYKQKGLGQDKMNLPANTSHKIITSNCQLYFQNIMSLI